jgi:hypothetical protein
MTAADPPRRQVDPRPMEPISPSLNALLCAGPVVIIVPYLITGLFLLVSTSWPRVFRIAFDLAGAPAAITIRRFPARQEAVLQLEDGEIVGLRHPRRLGRKLRMLWTCEVGAHVVTVRVADGVHLVMVDGQVLSRRVDRTFLWFYWWGVAVTFSMVAWTILLRVVAG